MLNYSLLGSRADIFLCHGILGSGQNWRTFARMLRDRRGEYGIALIDVRNHGRSPIGTPPHTVRACAEDLVALEEKLGKPKIVIGHSFGGKVVLDYAVLRTPEQLWMLDSPPGPLSEKPDDQSEVLKVISALRAVPVPLKKRKDLVDFLMVRGFSRAIANWMTTNLKREKEGYQFRFSLPVIEELIQDYFGYDGWSFLEDPPKKCDVHVLRAQDSDRWTAVSLERLRLLKENRKSSVHILPRAGHWVHVDNPEGLCNLFDRFLPQG
jgi:esterase